jgi:SAM-dependent methyltransferase
MTPETYSLAAQVEDRHWWFSGRRDILAGVLDRYLPRTPLPQILEIGCGNGGNLPLLTRYGNVFAVEMSGGARRRAAARGIAHVEAGALPYDIPYKEIKFDVVAALDVLEHISEEEAALATIRARLKPGGLLLLTVPAYRWLWSAHDVLSQHQRRYTRKWLVRTVRAAGFRVLHATYFNTFLFPIAVAYLKMSPRASNDPHHGMRMPGKNSNALLHSIFSAERYIVPRFRLPYGLSLLLCGTPD